MRIKKGDRRSGELGAREIVLKAGHVPEAPTLRMLGLGAGSEASHEGAVLEEAQEKITRSSKVLRRDYLH